MRLGMGSGPWAGLDIGAYSVKLVALQPRRWVPLLVLKRAANCNHLEPLTQQVTADLPATLRRWGPRSLGQRSE